MKKKKRTSKTNTKTRKKMNPTKKVKKTKKKEWNRIPQQVDLFHIFKASYNCKKKKRIELPLIEFVECYNNRGRTEWLLSIASNKMISLVSFFFYRNETMPMLLNAVGSTQIPGLLLLEEMLTAAPIKIENQCKFKTLLLEAIKRSIDIN